MWFLPIRTSYVELSNTRRRFVKLILKIASVLTLMKFLLFILDLVPDFLVIGKSMGNGHPVACLITKPEHADKFGQTGMKYFNTVNENPY